jgi:PIN domain nuclease of toxin-antitoxin system
MNVLLDTHICLWSMIDDPRLGAEARRLIQGASTVFVSTATLWEVAIRHALGKLAVGAGDIREYLVQSGAEFLPVLPEHCLALSGLPPLHSDPFDRMLVAQALVEPLHLVTHDQALKGYPGSIHIV